MVSRDSSKNTEQSHRSLALSLPLSHPPAPQLEGQNGQSLHKLQLVQLQKNVPRVLVILKDFDGIPLVLVRGDITRRGGSTSLRLQCQIKVALLNVSF